MSSTRSITSSSLLSRWPFGAGWGIALVGWGGLATPAAFAQGTTEPQPAQNAPLFYLIALLCLFGYLIFNYYSLNSRLGQMARDQEPEATPLASPFTWDDLADDSSGLPLFGERVAISHSGLYLVDTKDASLLTPLTANMIYQALSLEDVSVMYASQRMARDELGRALLALEAGTSWDGMPPAERTRSRRRLQSELDKYETNLYVFEQLDWTPEGIFSAWQQLKQGGALVGAIIIDDPAVARLVDARGVELLDRLRLVSVKCSVPIFVLVSAAPDDSRYWQVLGKDRLTGLLEVDRPSDTRALSVNFVKYPEAPPTASFELDAASGQIVVK